MLRIVVKDDWIFKLILIINWQIVRLITDLLLVRHIFVKFKISGFVRVYFLIELKCVSVIILVFERVIQLFGFLSFLSFLF